MTFNVRHINKSDLQSLFHLRGEKTYIKNTLQLPYPNLDDMSKIFEKDTSRWLVATKGEDVIGEAWLVQEKSPRRSHCGRLAMGVSESCRQQGVGSVLLAEILNYSDNWLNLKRLELEVYTDNEAAICLYKKFGFEIEGKGSNYAYGDGRFLDAFYMSRINS